MLEPIKNNVLYGHLKITNSLYGSCVSNKMPHALLFVGSSGIGKATLSYQLAKFLLLSSYYSQNNQYKLRQSQEVCSLFTGVSCITELLALFAENAIMKQIESYSHPDMMVLQDSRTMQLEAKKSPGILIDDIRSATQFLRSTSIMGGYRILIIDSIDYITNGAANALLKTLEEPGERTVIILISSSIYKVPVTITSRCCIIKFKPLSYRDFCKIFTNEPIKVSEDIYQLIGGDAGLYKKLINCNMHSIIEYMKDGMSLQHIQEVISFINTRSESIDILKKVLLKSLATKVKYTALSGGSWNELSLQLESFHQAEDILSAAQTMYLDQVNAIASVLLSLSR